MVDKYTCAQLIYVVIVFFAYIFYLKFAGFVNSLNFMEILLAFILVTQSIATAYETTFV